MSIHDFQILIVDRVSKESPRPVKTNTTKYIRGF